MPCVKILFDEYLEVLCLGLFWEGGGGVSLGGRVFFLSSSCADVSQLLGFKYHSWYVDFSLGTLAFLPLCIGLPSKSVAQLTVSCGPD